jgi:signal peptidase I
VPVGELESVMPASQNISGNYEYRAQLSNTEAADYRKRKPSVISVEKITATYDPGDTFMVRPCDTCKWTLDDFGPLYIPRPGETVNITEQNFNLYQHVPGITKGQFTIKEPLYFLMGDNRHGAEDSRFTGFISHSNMYGVVKL